MKSSNWKLVLDEMLYVESNDWIIDEQPGFLIRKLYSQGDKKFPVMTISIWPNLDHRYEGFNGFTISCAYKEKSGDWWENHCSESYIPLELFSDLQEMLLAAKEMIETKQKESNA